MSNIRESVLNLANRALQTAHELKSDDLAVAAVVAEIAAATSLPNIPQPALDLWAHDIRFVLAWGRCGFPQITMGHRLAASLMAMDLEGAPDGRCISTADGGCVSKDCMVADANKDFKLPFHTFVVVVPNGLLSLSDRKIDSLWVCREGDHLRVAVRTNDAPMLMLTTPMENLARAAGGISPSLPTILYEDDMAIGLAAKEAASVNRLIAVVFRLILGASAALIEQGHAAVPPKDILVDKKGRGRERPNAWTLHLSAEVEDDARPWLTQYLEGTLS